MDPLTKLGSTPATPVTAHPCRAEIDAEREGRYELVRLVRSITPEDSLEPGYFHDPVWTVRHVAAHLGTWLAETQVEHGA